MSAAAPRPVVAGNVYDKYGTRNPVARALQAGFERALDALLDQAGQPRRILEVGCGEGHVTARLQRRFPDAHVLGTDLSPEIVAEARRRHPACAFEVRPIEQAAADGVRWDLVVACEVFEHLDDPVRARREVARAGRRVLATVPREPLWRVLNVARGRYLGALGNTPGHLQHWSTRGFLAFLAPDLEVQAVRTPLPWTQVLARTRTDAGA